ncbi:IS3 family transposase [Paenibacillus puerhi]|uniref:IS3 family transposase n=1 Tax=Paenibacillus puerhi TaxID=2692622 RepID=UPI00135B9A84|nr:IS3 family transposase [Paenibacillus puerhi]
MYVLLSILEINESTYYDRRKRKTQDDRPSKNRKGRPVPGYSRTHSGEEVQDKQIKEWLMELLEGEEHVYGYKLLAQHLRKERGLILNKKKAYRLCKELGVLQQQRKRRASSPQTSEKSHDDRDQ